MWLACFAISLSCLLLPAIFPALMNAISLEKNRKMNIFHFSFVGVFLAVVFMFFPIHKALIETTFFGGFRALILSIFNAMQVFTIGGDFAVISGGVDHCPMQLSTWYQLWAALLFVISPIFTFGFVLSLFKNLSAYLKYLRAYFKKVFVFSELNEKSLVLASDIRTKNKNAAIVFTDVFDENEENTYELLERAKGLDAICFKKDILVIDFNKHSSAKPITFFTIGGDENENLNQSLKLIQNYKDRSDTHIYVFSTKIESELLLTAVDKGKVKVRRINEVHSLVNRILYEQGKRLFESARTLPNGIKKISAVVIGMGCYGTELLKSLVWYAQMDGYQLEINAFDADPLAEEKIIAIAPELMSPKYNAVMVDGEAQYKITIHAGYDVDSISFVDELKKISDATYVIVALGNDDININTAVKLRMQFERIKIHPVIQAIVYNSQQKNALAGIKNYRGQAYDIDFIGDLESSYVEEVIMDSELEADALRRHMKWGKEEEFWTYEYNYRSSMASAIHMRARIDCKIPGADKKEEDLSVHERNIIEVLEHRRWNAYMRAEGYIFSGSKDKSSRNDLAKMHHDLVDFSSLSEAEKRKDSSVGTK